MTAPEFTRAGRLLATRPNVCQVKDCHASIRILVVKLTNNRTWWVCRRCAEELCARPNWERVAER